MITKCSDIDFFPVEESQYSSSICVQLEVVSNPDNELRIYQLGEWRSDDLEYGTFSMSDRFSRSGGEALYVLKGRYDMFYVHNDGNRWIISMNTLTMDGWTQYSLYDWPRSEVALICDEKDLMACTQNKWMQNGTVFDRIKVAAGECGAGGLEWDKEKNSNTWKVPLIVCGCVVGALLLALGIYYFLKKQNKLGKDAVVGGTVKNEMIEIQDEE